MAVKLVPVAAFLAGAGFLAGGVVAAIEIASAVGALLVGGSFLGLMLRS